MKGNSHRKGGDGQGETLDDFAQRVELASSWESLPLSVSDRERLRELAANARRARDRAARGRPRCPRVALLGGDAKTRAQVAAAFADAAGVSLFRIDLAAIVSKYVGETEKHLGRVFAAAEAGDAVLLFDEADALFGERTEAAAAGDRYAGLDPGSLLELVEACDACALLGAGSASAIEKAGASRLDCVLHLDG